MRINNSDFKFASSVPNYIRFYDKDETTISDSKYFDLNEFKLKTNSLFNIFKDNTFGRVFIPANAIASEGLLDVDIIIVSESEKALSKPLLNKNIVCFGDSITEFKTDIGYGDGKRYSDYLSDISGAITYNAGVGGSRLAQRAIPTLTPSAEQGICAFDICNLVKAWTSDDWSLQNAALNSTILTETQKKTCQKVYDELHKISITDVDIVTIFGGTNDYTGGSILGDNVLSNFDRSNVCGAVNSMIKALHEKNPRLKIYMFTPIIRMFNNSVSAENSSDVVVYPNAVEGKTLPEFNEVIKNAAKNNHIPINDWYWDLGWNVYNFNEYFEGDFTHPYGGFRYLAERMYSYILSKNNV